MSSTDIRLPATATATAKGQAPGTAAADRRWNWPVALAVFGGLCLATQAWVWIAWLRTGPVAITRWRDTGDGSWKLAIAYQVGASALFVAVVTWVVRQCRKEGRLTFDAKFCLAGLATFWLDPTANVLLPVYTYSSQWVNLNDWLGQVPLVRNPDAGRLPEPVLFLLPLYTVGWLGAALAVNGIMRWVRRRFPHWRAGRALALAVVVALVCDILLELPMFLGNLWSNQGAPRIGLFADRGALYPVTEMLFATLIFTGFGALRYFRNDRGETLVERGLTGSHRRRAWISQLALIGVINAMWMGLTLGYTVAGLYSGPWRAMKPWVNNAVCDSPGVTGTRYGPCPGSPGFRLPLPGSLPGSKPNGDGRWLNGPTPCEGCPPVRMAGKVE